MLKYQKAFGTTLRCLFSDSSHWMRNRIKKTACPRNPNISQICAALDTACPPNFILDFAADDPFEGVQISEGLKETVADAVFGFSCTT